MKAIKEEMSRLTSLLKEDGIPSNIGEFEKHTKGFGSGHMKKFGFTHSKRIGKEEQGMIEPMPFIKNNRTAGLGSKGGLLGGMDPIRIKVVGKQPLVKQAMPTKPIKAQVKLSNISAAKANKGKTHMPQKSFYADYVLTWNRHSKVDAKYVGPA